MYFRPAELSGQVDTSRFSSAETSPAFYSPICFHHPFTFITPPYPQHFVHPSAYAAQSGHVALLSSPHSHIQASENSPANSETSSPPHSPLLQPVSGLSVDHGHGHIVGHVQPVPGPALHMMSPPAAVVADSPAMLEGKLLKTAKTSHMDSSGSEEDRSAGKDFCWFSEFKKV